MLILSLLAAIFICFVIPIGGILLINRKKQKLGKAFFIGVLAFTISQMFIRIPILTLVLPKFLWFQVMQTQPVLYGVFLGLTAALFEEGARYIGMRYFLKDKWELKNGIAFGLGHGGIEAILIVGLNYIVILVLIITGDSALVPAAFTPGAVLLGGMERLFAICFHTGESLLIMYGLYTKKSGVFLLAAILLHTICDAAIVILPKMFGVSTIGLEIYFAVLAIAVFIIGIWLYKNKNKRKED